MINARGGLDQPTYYPAGVNDRHFGYETADRTLAPILETKMKIGVSVVSLLTTIKIPYCFCPKKSLKPSASDLKDNFLLLLKIKIVLFKKT